MMTKVGTKIAAAVIAVLISLAGLTQGGGGGCSPSSTNPLCSSATPLVVGGSCINGTTCDGGAQSGSSCLYSGSTCSWYSFTATGTDMFVNIDVTATDGCHISSNVYNGTGGGGCIGAEISCQSGAPLSDMHTLSGLTIGNTYYVQVCYSAGGPCGNNGQADYCISVGEPAAPCNTCSSPCGTASGYATNPTVQNVVDDCLTTPFVPELQASSTHTFCYNFVATATSVNFNVIITSNCGGGNVTGLSWDLYNDPACGAAIQSGTLASLTFNGLTVGNAYVFCYTFTVPGTCTHTQHCPFFVGATIPLPVSLFGFNVEAIDNNYVEIIWNTASELNNDYFTIERSSDAINFEAIEFIEGAGTSTVINTYKSFDRSPLNGVSYYRLKQTDDNGESTYSDIQVVDIAKGNDVLELHPNPVNETGHLIFNSDRKETMIINVRDIFGRVVLTQSISAKKGYNSVILDLESLKDGLYLLTAGNGDEMSTLKFIKE